MKTMLAEFFNQLEQDPRPGRRSPNSDSKLVVPGCTDRSIRGRDSFRGYALLALILASMFPVHKAFAQLPPFRFDCDMSVGTCFSDSTVNNNQICALYASDPNGIVVGIMDTRNPAGNGAQLGMNWVPAMFHNASGLPQHQWIARNLGEVFGIALDGQTPRNIYVAATSVYPGDQFTSKGPGAIYKLDGGTFNISTFISFSTGFGNPPFVGTVSLGNICWDEAHNQLFAADLDNGLIRRVNAAGTELLPAYNHGTMGRPNAIPALSSIPDTSGFNNLTDLNRRVFALQTYQGRLYYSVWNNNGNEIWSVGLHPVTGAFITTSGGPKRESFFSSGAFSLQSPLDTAITDIALSKGGKMLVGERNLCANPTSNLGSRAHNARVMEFTLVGGVWMPGPPLQIGSFSPQRNSAGGVDYDCNDWKYATGDFGPPDYFYGVQILPTGAISPSQSYFVDYDGSVGAGNLDKTFIGDVEVYRCCPACLCITNKLVECISTNKTYKWEFCITNCWNMGIKYLSFLDLPPGLTINRDIVTLPSVLLPGQGVCLTLYLTNAPGLTNVCFTVGAHTTNFFECCSVTNCLTFAPCCVYLSGEKLTPIFMSPPMANCYNYTFTVKNVTWPPMPIKYMFMVQDPAPPPNCITFTPDVITFNPPLQPNQSMTKSVKVCLNPSSLCKAPYYFLASAHNSNLVECCSTRYCLPKASWCHPIDFPHGVDGSVFAAGTNIRVPVTIDRTFVQPRRAIGYDGTNAIATLVDPIDGQHDDWFVISNAVAGTHILRAELIDTLGGVWSTEEVTVYVVEEPPPGGGAPAPLLLVPAGALTVGQVRFLLPTELGVTCHVEYTESLSPANWQVFQTIVGDGTTVTVTDAATNAPQRFYRVRVE